MADKIIENNQVSIMGQIISPFTFSHQVFGEGFYLTDVLVKRLSDSEDRIPVMISERLMDVIPRPTRFFWTATSARSRSTERPPWGGRSPIFCWR